MRSLWVAVGLGLFACGDVQKVPDAAIPDAYTPDSPSMLSCGAGEMVCNNTCANLMTSELYCGNCTTQCSPTQGCLNGTCVPANTSCMRVRELDPTAGNGVYRNPNTGVDFYCDFANTMTYDSLSMGIYTSGYGGYTIITAAELQTAAAQAAWTALYNAQGGLITLQVWTSTNCCFSEPGGNDFKFGDVLIYPANSNGGAPITQCNQSPSYNTSPYILNRGATYMTTPIPDDFLTTNPPTSLAQCSDGSNPGMFWRKRNTLN